jgi:sensor c-di-GMP phosphodiesterase-like protein
LVVASCPPYFFGFHTTCHCKFRCTVWSFPLNVFFAHKQEKAKNNIAATKKTTETTRMARSVVEIADHHRQDAAAAAASGQQQEQQVLRSQSAMVIVAGLVGCICLILAGILLFGGGW